VTIGFERTSGSVIGWTLANKTFRSTLLSREEGVTTNREDEDRLIIAVEELLFSPQSVQTSNKG
jgi:methyltransferase-like protein